MRRHRKQAVKEDPRNNIHRNTTEAREYLTAIFARDYEIARLIESSTPELRAELAEIWVDYLIFLRAEFGEEEASEHWRLFCEYSTVTAEVERQQ